jgi:small subunit ribosomal protein S14
MAGDLRAGSCDLAAEAVDGLVTTPAGLRRKDPADMAKTSTIAKEKKKVALAERHLKKRAELKAKIIDQNLSDDERQAAMFALTKLPRNGSRARVKRRCQATGASHAVYRKFQLNRISFRNMALQGLLPGVTKASW